MDHDIRSGNIQRIHLRRVASREGAGGHGDEKKALREQDFYPMAMKCK
jgi:hypothetical protein